jgi:hypothetical protein
VAEFRRKGVGARAIPLKAENRGAQLSAGTGSSPQAEMFAD